jgi:hypothetical protein
MWKTIQFALVFSLAMPHALAFLGDNKKEDSFAVVKIEEKTATLSGEIKDLKVGDKLYSVKSPYQYTVSEIQGKIVTVTLPDGHKLTESSALLRKITPAIKKNIDTESRLKEALEE